MAKLNNRCFMTRCSLLLFHEGSVVTFVIKLVLQIIRWNFTEAPVLSRFLYLFRFRIIMVSRVVITLCLILVSHTQANKDSEECASPEVDPAESGGGGGGGGGGGSGGTSGAGTPGGSSGKAPGDDNDLGDGGSEPPSGGGPGGHPPPPTGGSPGAGGGVGGIGSADGDQYWCPAAPCTSNADCAPCACHPKFGFCY